MSVLDEYYYSVKNWRSLLRFQVNAMSLRDLRAFSWILIDNYYLKHDECRSSQTMHVSNNFNKQLAEEVFHLALDMVNFRLFRDKEEKKKMKRINFLRVYFQARTLRKYE